MQSMQALYVPIVSGQALLALGALLTGLCAAPSAVADRPLTSETADVIGPGECQLEAALLRTAVRGEARLHGQELFGSCGLPWDTQLGLLLAREHGGGGPRLRLLGVHGKTTLVAPDENTTGWGIAYGMTSDHLSGEGWQHGSPHITLAATRRLGAGLIGHLNLGWERAQRDHASSTAWSLGIEREGGAWGWALDLFGDDRSRPWVSGGVLLEVNAQLSLNLGYARQLDAQRAQQWTLGSKIRF